MKKLRLRSGQDEVEIECAGNVDAAALEIAFSGLARLKALSGASAANARERLSGQTTDAEPSPDGDFDQGINSYVGALGAGSCRSILKAAAIHLSLAEGISVFSKQAWFDRAAEAHDWQRDFSNQRARDVRRLVAGKEITEKNGGMFAVPAKALSEARLKLAND